MQRSGRTRKTSLYARGACAACLIASLAACSSGGHKSAATTTTSSTTVPPSTTTTLPTAQSKAAVQAYFAGPGRPVIEFERVGAPLITGTTPTRAACLQWIKTDVPKITKNPDSVVPLAQHIPNAPLAAAVTQDVRSKLLVGKGCGEAALKNQAIPSGASGYRILKGYVDESRHLLMEFGITA